MVLISLEHFSCRTSKIHREQGTTSEMFERVLIVLRSKQNVKFRAGLKFRIDRPSRLHKRAAARAHHGSRAGRLRRPNHGCGSSSCRECLRRWRQGPIAVARCWMRRLQHHGGRSHSAEVGVYTGARLGPLCKPQRSCTQWHTMACGSI